MKWNEISQHFECFWAAHFASARNLATTLSFIEGTFERKWTEIHGAYSERITIEKKDPTSGIFYVTSVYAKEVQEGKEIVTRKSSVSWIATFNTSTRQLIPFVGDATCSFLPSTNQLYLEGREFTKIVHT